VCLGLLCAANSLVIEPMSELSAVDVVGLGSDQCGISMCLITL
jgi:hypothetical protein